MVYLPTFTIKNHPNVGKYTSHGSYGYRNLLSNGAVYCRFTMADPQFKIQPHDWASNKSRQLSVRNLWCKWSCYSGGSLYYQPNVTSSTTALSQENHYRLEPSFEPHKMDNLMIPALFFVVFAQAMICVASGWKQC